MWWKLSTIITCGTLAGAIIPELVKVFTSVDSAPRAGSGDVVARRRRVAQHSLRPGGRQLQRLLAGHDHDGADGHRVMASARMGMDALMLAPAVFAFGLVAFGFLGMGPVTIAVDSYGPVTDNAQSVYELSHDRGDPQHQGRAEEELRLRRRFREGQASPGRERRRGQHLQSDRETRADRHGRGGRHHHDLLDHRGADQWTATGTVEQSLDPASAVPARA